MTLRNCIVGLVLFAVALVGGQLLRRPSPVQSDGGIDWASELSARPKKGLGYMPNRVVRVNSAGDLEVVIGSATDCVRADGSAAPCEQASAGADVFSEVPSGTLNGTNAVFSVANAPVTGTLRLYRNGMRQKGGGFDYSISGSTITFVTGAVPQPGDTLLADYRY